MATLGIDLGTTHSSIAFWKDGEAKIIPNRDGETLTPSVISVTKDKEILVGKTAKHLLITEPESSAELFKRDMGSDKVVKLRGLTFRPEELSALLLKHLKSYGEEYLGSEINDVVISVPAYFNSIQRTATMTAGKLAGLNVKLIVNEPSAAALSYGIGTEIDDALLLVLDLGGGTFDISILDVFDGVIEVRGCAGDNFLGGQDFTEVLIEAFLEDHDLKLEDLSITDIQRIVSACEFGKRVLTTEEKAEVSLLLGEKTLHWDITNERYMELSESLFKRIRKPIERALRDCNVKPEQFAQVILVGGASQMPIFQTYVQGLIGREVRASEQPEEIVALGAAVQAGLLDRDDALEDIVVTDVSSHTLGIELSLRDDTDNLISGRFSPIIERNTLLPVSRTQTVVTLHDNQEKLTISVYQGESRIVSQNLHLGDLKISLPKAPAGEEEVEVRFSFDANGVLDVQVKTISTGETAEKVFTLNEKALSEEEIAASLEKLKKLKSPARDREQYALIFAKLGVLYHEFLGIKRENIGTVIDALELAIERNDKRMIRDAEREAYALLSQFNFEGE